MYPTSQSRRPAKVIQCRHFFSSRIISGGLSSGGRGRWGHHLPLNALLVYFDCVGDKVLPLLSAVTLHQGLAQAIQQPIDIQLARTKSAYSIQSFQLNEAQQLHPIQLLNCEYLDPPSRPFGG